MRDGEVVREREPSSFLYFATARTRGGGGGGERGGRACVNGDGLSSPCTAVHGAGLYPNIEKISPDPTKSSLFDRSKLASFVLFWGCLHFPPPHPHHRGGPACEIDFGGGDKSIGIKKRVALEPSSLKACAACALSLSLEATAPRDGNWLG